MFQDPVTLTIDGNAITLPRTNSTPDGGTFVTSDRSKYLTVRHTYGKRVRHEMRLRVDSLAASPLVSGQNITQSMSAYIVVDTPVGYDTALAKKNVDGLVALLAASSGAALVKLLGGES